MNLNTASGKSDWRTSLLLFLAGLAVTGAAAAFLRAPGYMDAEYYFMNGQRIAAGEGFTEMVVWNYLDDPRVLPHPSHTYWLPFTSLVAALGMWVFQRQSFIFAQIPFVLAAACVPVITHRIAGRIYTDRRDARLAGVLGLFPGFYLAFQGSTSTLGLYMLGGAIFFLILTTLEGLAETPPQRKWLCRLLGSTAGVLYLTRSDGVLWASAAVAFALFYRMRPSENRPVQSAGLRQVVSAAAWVMVGFLVITGFWLARNVRLFGSLMPPGGSRTLWLTDYDQMFAFPADGLTFSAWLSSGLGEILSVRAQSLWENLKTLLAVEGEILLLPLAIMGIWHFRRRADVKTMLLLWVATFLLMSLVFPFAGQRGGFLHSSAAFQPFLWVMAPAGFSQVIQWGIQKRGWKPSAWRYFAVLLCLLLAGYTAAAYSMKVIGPDAQNPLWQQSSKTYTVVESAVRETFPDPDTLIVVNNPPGYSLASGGRPAVVLPDGDEQALLAVADRFGAGLAAIDRNITDGLRHLYEQPKSYGRLEFLYSVGDTRIYRIKR